MDSTEIAGLLARVKAATGPSQEVDARLWHALNPEHRVLLDEGKAFGRGPKRPTVFGTLAEFSIDGWDDWDGVCRHIGAPPLTSSIDAALALVERVLPGWWVQVRVGASFQPEAWCERDGRRSEMVRGETPALAILAALLTAIPGGPDAGR